MDAAPEDWYERLTIKERQVLETYAVEHSYEGVARKLHKSESAVDQLLVNVRRKMGVTSTAEAMLLLGERRANLSAEAVAAPGPSVDSPAENLRTFRMSGVAIFSIAVLAVTVLWAAFAIFSHGSQGTSRGPFSSNEPSARSVARQISNLKLTSKLEPEQSARAQAGLVALLSDQLWLEMWGSKETDDARNVLPSVSKEIVQSFDWACIHDEDLAVRIIANGHRMFKLAGPPLADWPIMVSRALMLSHARKGRHYGRLCCAFAFSKLYRPGSSPQDLAKAFTLCDEARDIFGRLPDGAWDEANAMRHMGMCCAQSQRDRALALYKQALEIYERMNDMRGTAQTKLSLAQLGVADASSQTSVAMGTFVLDAIKSCRETGSDEMLGEAWDEMRIYPRIPQSSTYLLHAFRDEERLKAADEASRHEGRARWLTLVDCFEIDRRLGDRTALAEDIETAFGDTLGISSDACNRMEVLGFYEAICERIGRPKNAQVLEKEIGSTKDIATGHAMSEEQFLRTAATMIR